MPYRVGKASSHWQGQSVDERIGRLQTGFAALSCSLATPIGDIARPLPHTETLKSPAALKPVEEALDTLIWCGAGCG